MFKYNGQIKGNQSPGTLDLIITGSAVIKTGDAVKSVAGFISPATAGDKVLGIVRGIVTAKGLPLDDKNVRSGREFNGTYVRGGYGVETYTAASDNTTVDKIKATVIIDNDATYINDCAGDLTTAMLFTFFNLADAHGLAAKAAGEVAGTFQLVGLDPEGDSDASKGLFIITESQLGSYTVS